MIRKINSSLKIPKQIIEVVQLCSKKSGARKRYSGKRSKSWG